MKVINQIQQPPHLHNHVNPIQFIFNCIHYLIIHPQSKFNSIVVILKYQFIYYSSQKIFINLEQHPYDLKQIYAIKNSLIHLYHMGLWV